MIRCRITAEEKLPLPRTSRASEKECLEMGEFATRSTADIQLSRFVIEIFEAQQLMRDLGVESPKELLPLLVPAAQRLARPPISRYHVGAVGLGASGRIYIGVNIEFLGVPLHHSVHAEQFLVANAAAHGEASIAYFAVSAVPCGHCRQFLQELRNASEIEIHVTSECSSTKPEYRPLSHYLPSPFGPPDLLAVDVPLLLEPHNNPIEALDEEYKKAVTLICNGRRQLEDKVRLAAENAARGSHAPYSGCAAGFAVADRGGGSRVWAGGYAESAAYNPSLGPVQAALIAWIAGGGGDWDSIEAAALVEPKEAAVSHEDTARLLLSKVAPKCRFRLYRYKCAKD